MSLDPRLASLYAAWRDSTGRGDTERRFRFWLMDRVAAGCTTQAEMRSVLR